MSVTRVEKAGSIFNRITNLIRTGQLKWENRPLWYDAYASLPPFIEPVWNVKYTKEGDEFTVKSIFYPEDVVRAKFYKKFPSIGAINIHNDKSKSVSQAFIDHYNNLSKKRRSAEEMNNDEEVFNATLDIFRSEGLVSTSRRNLGSQNS